MADEKRRLASNVPGPLFVDASCIDCDTCRALEPEVYVERDGQSVVQAQPSGPEGWRRALRALIACPTSSIGVRAGQDDAVKAALAAARAAFPEPVDDEVAYCGWTSPDSYGASSYLLQRAAGNVLVDTPRFAEPLLERIRAAGGASMIFLTHQDDVADHDRWAKALGAVRVIHARDRGHGTRAVERVLEGDEPTALAPDLTAIPTPGHTRGHQVLLHADRHLFTGDHLAGDDDHTGLIAFRGECWYDWSVQTESMRRLQPYRFEWVLPGHGRRFHAAPDAMACALAACVRWMEAR